MPEIKTLTINGKKYTVADPDQPRLEAQIAKIFSATAIICAAAGEQIEVNDSAEHPLQGLTVYGRSVQNGTQIRSVGAENGHISLYIPQAFDAATVIRSPRDVAAPIGETVQFDVIAAGRGLGYQWQFNDGYGWNDTTNTGYNTPVLTIQAAEYRIGYQYRCKVTAADGTEAVSAAATLSKGDALSYGQYAYGAGPQLRIDTPNGLHGLPVSGGGNYTDKGGRMWVCDTVGNGQYIKRIGHIASYNGEEIPGEYMSSTGGLTAGAEVLYVLADPVMAEPDAETVAAVRALRTCKPSTTIINDAGAGMAVEYVADPKTYIDNKFAELATAMAGS